MELILAKDVSYARLEQFIKNNPDVDKSLLMEKGYVVQMNEQIEGCFVLDAMEDGVHWLKKLHVTRQAAEGLPVIIESILAIAKENQATCVYVHSQQPLVDILLESLQFRPQQEECPVNIPVKSSGNWWAYEVS
ncbi:hypothetical protein CFK37_07805 [Virgibacillus phasianinus]|uniref:N-acetyltransferase domain-containing protein n=1 Tax=Virgibacillus phasianinus TaxID=2017483 RepID=A0A220U259_9BACI|nr:hypothetical protein [Virgibacillus phasianinus]ASK62072.1 hypothetical protein CFK37_07805 [Virgibacillus phasianinus]